MHLLECKPRMFSTQIRRENTLYIKLQRHKLQNYDHTRPGKGYRMVWIINVTTYGCRLFCMHQLVWVENELTLGAFQA